MKIFKGLILLFLLFFIGNKFFINNNSKENGLTKKEQNAIKRSVAGDYGLFEQLRFSDLAGLNRKVTIVNGDVVITGRGMVPTSEGKEQEMTFNIRFSKKNNVYIRDLTTNFHPNSNFVCSLDLMKLIDYGTHGFSDSAEENVLKIMQDFDYGYMIKAESAFSYVKVYFDDGDTSEEIINNNAVFFEISDKDKKVRSFSINGVIGEYNDLSEASRDVRNSPVPKELALKKKYSKKSRLTSEDSKEIVSSFSTGNYYIRVVKQSSIFYKALIWNKNNLTEKPDVIFSNGKKDSNYSTYVFEQNNKVVTIVKDSMLEIVDRFDTEKSIKERAVD